MAIAQLVGMPSKQYAKLSGVDHVTFTIMFAPSSCNHTAISLFSSELCIRCSAVMSECCEKLGVITQRAAFSSASIDSVSRSRRTK